MPLPVCSCRVSIIAADVFAGKWRNNSIAASNPPAEPPIPTIGQSSSSSVLVLRDLVSVAVAAVDVDLACRLRGQVPSRAAVDPDLSARLARTLRVEAFFFGLRFSAMSVSSFNAPKATYKARFTARGGVAIVQDPSEAMMPSMPQSALQMVDVDYCLPVPADC